MSSRGEKFMRDFAALYRGGDRDRPPAKEDVVRFYDEKAGEYDGDLLDLGSAGPVVVADKLAGVVPQERRADFRVLDVAAGTGRGGQALKERGFNNIDALDPSRASLEVAAGKGAYTRLLCQLFAVDDVETPLESCSYDAVTVAGAFTGGHLPARASLREAARILKPGGYFVNGMIFENIAASSDLELLEPEMDRMESEGVWTKVERDRQARYREGKSGLYHVYQKL